LVRVRVGLRVRVRVKVKVWVAIGASPSRGQAFSPTEQLEKAKLTQLTFEGLSLEVETLTLT
tara:strand:- start:171 stop:356 length:186 start_codon:yes stop_codon:yes gene_type:complete